MAQAMRQDEDNIIRDRESVRLAWKTGRVQNMYMMFRSAKSFNQPINTNVTTGAWDVMQVLNMDSMFKYAESFNQSLDRWNPIRVELMYEMFFRATAFHQNIDDWIFNLMLM